MPLLDAQAPNTPVDGKGNPGDKTSRVMPVHDSAKRISGSHKLLKATIRRFITQTRLHLCVPSQGCPGVQGPPSLAPTFDLHVTGDVNVHPGRRYQGFNHLPCVVPHWTPNDAATAVHESRSHQLLFLSVSEKLGNVE